MPSFLLFFYYCEVNKLGLAAFNRMRRQQAEKLAKEVKKQKIDNANYEEMKVPDLKELAKEKEIKGYANMKKDELIEALTALKVVDDSVNSK